MTSGSLAGRVSAETGEPDPWRNRIPIPDRRPIVLTNAGGGQGRMSLHSPRSGTGARHSSNETCTCTCALAPAPWGPR